MFQFEVVEPTAALNSNSSTSLASESSTSDLSCCSSVDNATEIFSVGDRVICDNYLGTVRFIGVVAPHPGNWLGVEWDDPSRGRHDGAVNGVQFFKSIKPNAASFVRPNKVKRCKRITEAIRERYGHDPDLISSLKDIAGGLDRMKIDYSELKIIDVSSKQVSDLERPGILNEFSPKLEFVNIADNLLTDWEEIANACLGLENLKRLDVSENQLEPVSDNLSNTLLTVFQKVEHLIMGKVNYDWESVIKISYTCLNVKNLQLQYNKISRIIPPTETLQNVSNLDLGWNQLSSWEEVLKLDAIPGLEYLNLAGNRLTAIHFQLSNDGSTTNQFSSLVRLNVTENSLSDWQSVNELNKLRSLRELRIDTNPFLYADTKENNRQFLIARIGKLQKLEGVDIARQERRDSELDYLKKYTHSWNTPEGKAEFKTTHPRYAELIKVYGQFENAETDQAFTSMKTSLINVQLIPEDKSKPPVTKKLLPSLTVQKLKMMLQRIFAVPRAQIEITVVSSKNANISFVLDNDFFLLSQYSVEDGDQMYLKW